MEKFLFNEAQAIDYTIVRPPRLTDESLTGTSHLYLNF